MSLRLQRNTAPRRRGWKHRFFVFLTRHGVVRGTPPRGAGVGNKLNTATLTIQVAPEEHRPEAQGLETSAMTPHWDRAVRQQRNTAPRRRGWKLDADYLTKSGGGGRGTPPRGAGVGNLTQGFPVCGVLAEEHRPEAQGLETAHTGSRRLERRTRGTPPRGAGVGNSTSTWPAS